MKQQPIQPFQTFQHYYPGPPQHHYQMPKQQDTILPNSSFAFNHAHDLTSCQTPEYVHYGGIYPWSPSIAWGNCWLSHGRLGDSFTNAHLKVPRKAAGIFDWSEIDQDMFRLVSSGTEPYATTADQFPRSGIPSGFGMGHSRGNEISGTAFNRTDLFRMNYDEGLCGGGNELTFLRDGGRVTRTEIPASDQQHLQFRNPFWHHPNTFATRDQMGNTTSQPEQPDGVDDADSKMADGKSDSLSNTPILSEHDAFSAFFNQYGGVARRRVLEPMATDMFPCPIVPARANAFLGAG
jgi:hypothetical protein